MYTTAYLDIAPLTAAHGTVQLPGSKSISNRVLLLSFLTELTTGQSTQIEGLLDSEDTQVMRAALSQLTASDALAGQGGHQELFLGNAGTAMRPLTAAMALLGVGCTLDGVARMRERPIGDLVDALNDLGCNIVYVGNAGFPPLKIGKPTLNFDAPIKVRGDVSSQFLTALLLTLPLVAKQDITVEVIGELISKPYIDITIKLLACFGVVIAQEGWSRFVIPADSKYVSPNQIAVEADASSASYFVALGGLAATADKPLRIEGVGADSIQGDIRFVEAAQMMGVSVKSEPHALMVWREDWSCSTGFLQAVNLDCNHIPDAAMTLAVMALYAKGTTTLRNIASWRVKETDRLSAMAIELRKLGATVEEGADYISITPPASPTEWRSASIHTYDDHRMAMCFSLAAFNPAGKTVRIEDPKCVAKTYPDYFEALFALAKPASTVPVICIDGPTASGKGTLASLVAKSLGYHYLDSGALYRLVGYAASLAGIDLQDGKAVGLVARGLQARFAGDQVFLQMNNEWQNVSDAIRNEAAGMDASKVSAHPEVREALMQLQLDFAKLPGLVADGRDMGTVIFPAAPLKVFLTASAQVRAQRRYKQLISKGISATIDTLCADLEARDERDRNRSAAPLVAAQDAIELDNTHMSIDESVKFVLKLWDQKQNIAN